MSSHTQPHLLLLNMLGEWGTCVLWYPSGSQCQAAPKDAGKKQSHRYREQTGLPAREGGGVNWEIGIDICKVLCVR